MWMRPRPKLELGLGGGVSKPWCQRDSFGCHGCRRSRYISTQQSCHFGFRHHWETLIGMNDARPPMLHPLLFIYPCSAFLAAAAPPPARSRASPRFTGRRWESTPTPRCWRPRPYYRCQKYCNFDTDTEYFKWFQYLISTLVIHD